MYGILIGTITDPAGKTVTFMVMLVFLPTLFIDRPIHSAITTTSYVAIFIALCTKHKTGDVLFVDVIDAIVFGLLGVASGLVINLIKVRSFVFERKLHAISRLDQMTQMQNQNAFMMDLTTVSNIFRNSLACVYIDANGLHDLNNVKGHAEGDKMLKCVAETVTEIFGNKVTYRVGGDEFVAFAPDIRQTELSHKIIEMITKIEDNGYSIAVGYEVVHTHQFNVDEFIKAADFRMQEDKKRHKTRRDT
jgi:diguanylate cyclase (GGDEF)-like protein